MSLSSTADFRLHGDEPLHTGCACGLLVESVEHRPHFRLVGYADGEDVGEIVQGAGQVLLDNTR